jgi:hypothetical protein
MLSGDASEIFFILKPCPAMLLQKNITTTAIQFFLKKNSGKIRRRQMEVFLSTDCSVFQLTGQM